MLQIREHTALEITGWAKRFPAIEVCGLVYRLEDGSERVRPMLNSHSKPDKFYEVSVAEMVTAYKEMDALGGTPVAFYHSHPHPGSAGPSETDMQAAMNVGMHYLIAYPLAQYPDPMEWRLGAWECIEMGVLVQAELEMRP